ncbi:TPA: 3'-5' exoribonuclease [Klebsiella pneumoniae]|uniref:3'-5' exonuclease n=1 Tax=Klebsiella pneumoniae TaxID=573 RepID=UPI0013C2E4BC|nr:3'-5' exonuclease [Klebsiella pneumoniae]HBR1366639.1 3'-5' exoribonuclease [Klebsiella pneumoniae]HBR2015034.1 3'-5' exoribonuclease [Klebsiella pneumoniae]
MEQKFNHVMIDIEALDNKPTAAIASIAAAFFEPVTGTVGPSLYLPVDIVSSESGGGTLGADTVKWWLKQSAEARAEINSDRCICLFDAMEALNVFIDTRCNDSRQLKVWARGTDYDLPIIYHAMRQMGITPFWHFWNVRDVRSVEEVSILLTGIRSVKVVSPEKHHALADVLNQIAQLSDNLSTIEGRFAVIGFDSADDEGWPV